MSVMEFLSIFLETILFDLCQSIFRAICEVAQILKNSHLFLKEKYFFDKTLEFE